MATYEHLRRDPSTQVLFNNRIRTLEGLQGILQNHAFIALDTEHVPVESQRNRVLHQVGLAYIPTMAPHDPVARPNQGQPPRIESFYTENRLQSLTLNVNLNDQTRQDLIRYRGSIPNRRPSRFGCEYHIDLENVELVIIDFIQYFHCDPSMKLVLIGFEMPAEWTYLSRNFPGAIPHFTSWIDLRDIAKDIALAGDAPVRNIPGLLSMLHIFGYHWKNIKNLESPDRHGSADNAGEDAVATLAIAEALFSPENQAKLLHRQRCRQIARKGYVFNEDNITFGATIQSQTGILPKPINSSIKLSKYFFGFKPISIALKSTALALITFDSEERLNRFIQENHRRSLPTGETLLVMQVKTSEAEIAKREERHQLRETKKAEMLSNEFEGFGNIFE
ncbi:hypothetical protein F4802DRAFT_607324 [Xylaria palmicola]|nr:hypothetical protein F4802DRAFT_607324 [Xylaria palmicola]